MKRIQFAATVAATGLWVLGGVATAQTGQSNQGQYPGATGQTGRQHRGQGQTSKSQNAAGTLSKFDHDFLTKAAEGGLAEVELGKLAEQKGASDAIKDLGQKLVTDHTKANNDLQQLAQSKGVTLPTAPHAKQKAEYNRLSRLSDGEFDREFARSVDRDHKKDIAEFRKEADKGSDPDVKSFASSNIPTLEEHEKMAAEAMHGAQQANPRTDETGNPSTRTGKKGKRQPDYNH